jgi:Ca2+-binding EF-hand superfamily protein
MDVPDEEFNKLFKKFDVDGDGVLSYEDFQLTVGSVCHPAEGLYFR